MKTAAVSEEPRAGTKDKLDICMAAVVTAADNLIEATTKLVQFRKSPISTGQLKT